MEPTVVLPVEPDESRSGEGFRVGMYREHLEEAASLWEQRPADRENPDLAWSGLGYDEGRLEAHLDALVLGGDLALAVCRARALAGDPGEIHAALRVLCRHARADLVADVMEGLDPEDADAMDAMAEALAIEMPEAWEAGAAARLADPRWRRLAAEVVRDRRRPPPAAWRAAPGADDPVRAAVVRAIGRGPSASFLTPLLADDDAEVRREAALALLRGGVPDDAARVLAAIRDDAALLPLLGLAGRASATAWLAARVDNPDACLALALLGDPAAIPALIGALAGAAPDDAAIALFTITGADLQTSVFVEDVPEPDEWFDDERAAGAPEAPPGPPRGTVVTGLSTDPAEWQAWWDAHGEAFVAGQRYRLGRPAGPTSEVASIAGPSLPHRLRTWAAEALVVRYRMPVAFETTWPVARQRAALADMARWAGAQPFVDGRWYVGAQYVE